MFQRFNNLNLGHKINLGFAALVLTLLLIVGLIFVAGSAATDRINLTVDVRVPTTLVATSAQSNLLKMQAAVRGYLAVGDLQNIDDYNQARDRFQANLAQLKRLSADWTNQADVERLNQLIDIFAAWLSTPEQLFALHDNPLENQPALRLETMEMQPLNGALLADVERLARQLQLAPGAPAVATLDELNGFRASFEGMSTNLSAYAATGDLLFKFRYSDELVTNSRHYGALAELLAVAGPSALQANRTNAPREIFQRITAMRSTLLGLSGQIFAAVEGEQSYLDLYLFQNEMEPKTEQMVALLEALAVNQQRLLQAELNEGNRLLTDLRYQTLLGGVLVLLLGAAMVYIFRRNIAKPLHRLSRTAERIGAGELSARVGVETDDEIGHLAVSFNRMTDQLNETIQALAEARDSAEAASRAKSKFLASMSHELRTPLNVILGYAQILQRTPNQIGVQQDALHAIQNNGEHLLSLITDILDLSKIEAQKLELSPTEFVLADFLANLAHEYQNRAAEAVSFAMCLSERLPATIRADEKRLRQILLNLLENAFKFTCKGHIELSAVLMDATADAALVNFAVRDTGIGISADELARIFHPFEQVGVSAERAQGTGLGLAIAQELVDAMHGTLTVESAPARGSTFAFAARFPAGWHKPAGHATVRGRRPQPPHQTDKAAATQSAASAATQLQPIQVSDEALAELYEMALKGELPKLKERSAELLARDAANKQFVERLHTLIQRYEEEKILTLLASWPQER